MNNAIAFKVFGRYALFTDPITKIGGEKFTYQIPTYEALVGMASSIYWKPTFTWIIDKVRILKPICTEVKNVKPLVYGGGNTLAMYTYLVNVEYQVQAHFEWNFNRQDMEHDRNDGKHHSVALRMVAKGGRGDIFLGSRECQGYVEPGQFHEGAGYYDNCTELAFGLMFHGFDYPDVSGEKELKSRFWKPTMKSGVIEFIRPDECSIYKKVRNMKSHPPKSVGLQEKGLFE